VMLIIINGYVSGVGYNRAPIANPCHPANKQDEEELVLPLRSGRSPLNGLCCLTFGLVVFMSGLVLASIYVYRYYFIPQSLFHCRVRYEDSVYAPLRGRQELEENVGIYLEDNYEQISVPVPHFGGSDPADIIHDFHRKGTYLPQTYIIQEEMFVTGRVHNMRQLGPFIYRLCNGKDTYRLKRRARRRINKREVANCHRIRHFENTFVVETVICDGV
uniref:Integral membrane protein 2 n=1 Tax=Oncorhynchus mykiss TaxID=8022 RepID=A0A8K9WU20_ONCMY